MSPRPDPLLLEREVLDNGTVLVTQPSPSGSVTFAASWFLDAGSARDPPGKEGVASLVGRLLTLGTRHRPKRVLAQELDRMAATLSSGASWEGVEVEISGPADLWSRLLEILHEAVTVPSLEGDEFARLRREAAETLLREKTQPGDRAERAFLASLFPPGHPYLRHPLGTERSLARLKRDDATRFHHQLFTPRGSRLVITTQVPGPELLRVVQRTFGAMVGPPPQSRPTIPAPLKAKGPLYIPIAGTSQAEVLVGGHGVARHHEDFPALVMANEVLGGRPMLSRLFQVVREERGLAYSAGSELEALLWDGLWNAEAGTDPGHVAQVESLLDREVRRLAEVTLAPSELDRIRESLLGSAPLYLETTNSAHSLAVEVADFDLPLDHFRRWPETLRALTPRQVREAAHRHFLNGAGMRTVASGPPRPTGK